MDADERLELIGMIASDSAWEIIVKVGQVYLDEYYPCDIFTGSSGDPGPAYVVALREALKRVTEGRSVAWQ